MAKKPQKDVTNAAADEEAAAIAAETEAAAASGADDDGAEFEDAFDEFAGDSKAESADDSAPSKDDDTDDDEAAGGAGDDDAEDNANDDDAAGDGGEEGADDVDDDAKGEQAEEDKRTPEELRAALDAATERADKADHRSKSDGGRHAALQRKVDGLQAQLDAATASGSDAGKEEASEADTAELESFRTEYPEIAGPVMKLIGDKDTRIKSLEKRLASGDAVAQEKYLDDQESLLADQHPDWEAATDSEEFKVWFQKQPPYVQNGIARNSENIVDGAEAAHLIQQFKDMTGYKSPQPEPADDNDNGEAAEEVVVEAKPNKPLSGKRQRQLKAAAGAGSKGPGASSGPPDDFDSAFDHFAGKKKKAS